MLTAQPTAEQRWITLVGTAVSDTVFARAHPTHGPAHNGSASNVHKAAPGLPRSNTCHTFR